MEVVKKTDDHVIVKKRSGRYGVRDASKKWVGGDEKVKILADAGLITPPKKKETPPPEAEEAAAEEATEEAGGEEEAAAEE